MPLLPTLNVSDEQAARCVDAWGSVAAYKAWLAHEVKEFVLAKERLAIKSRRMGEIKSDIDALTDPMEGAT